LNALVDDDAHVEIHDEWLTVDERLERENSRRQQAVTLRHETNLRPAHQNHDIGDAIERENTEAQATSKFQPQTVLETPRQVQFGRNRMVVIDDSLLTNRATRPQTSILRTPVETLVPRTPVIADED
jgi:putative ribosome biogenesis GTPase RsgA